MLSSTIGTDFNDPQPLHITYRDGQPCDEIILAPIPKPLTSKQAQKAATKARLAKEDAEARSQVKYTLSMYGPIYKRPGSYIPPDGAWTSGTPNEFLTLDCARGALGQAETSWEPKQLINPVSAHIARIDRENDGFDAARLEETRAAVESWKGVRPWKNCPSPSGELKWIQFEG
jgi:hypothetical protein